MFRSRVKTSAANEPIYTNDAKFELWRSNEPGRPDKPKFRPITGRLSSAKSTSAQPHTAQGRIHGMKISIFGLVSRFIACDSKFRFFTKLKKSILEKNLINQLRNFNFAPVEELKQYIATDSKNNNLYDLLLKCQI